MEGESIPFRAIPVSGKGAALIVRRDLREMR